jgi:hypothetical protein
VSTIAAEPWERSPPTPASRRRRRLSFRALAHQLLLPHVRWDTHAPGPATDARRASPRAVGHALRDGARQRLQQLVLPGFERLVNAAAAALLRIVAPPPTMLDVPSPRRPVPPVPTGWTPTIRVGEPAPAPAIVHRSLPVLPPEKVQSPNDRFKCEKKNAVLSAGSCLQFQHEAEARLRLRTAEAKRRAPSAYESTRPVLTLCECIDCDVGRVATATWRFRRAAHARLTRKGVRRG